MLIIRFGRKGGVLFCCVGVGEEKKDEYIWGFVVGGGLILHNQRSEAFLGKSLMLEIQWGESATHNL